MIWVVMLICAKELMVLFGIQDGVRCLWFCLILLGCLGLLFFFFF